jgi:hypothetical protein
MAGFAVRYIGHAAGIYDERIRLITGNNIVPYLQIPWPVPLIPPGSICSRVCGRNCAFFSILVPMNYMGALTAKASTREVNLRHSSYPA